MMRSRYRLPLARIVPAVLLVPAAAQAVPTGTPAIAHVTTIGIIASSTPTVQCVIALLFILSVATWAMLLYKLTQLRRVSVAVDRSFDRLKLAPSLAGVSDIADRAVIWLLDAARREMKRSGDLIADGRGEGIQQRVALMLERTEDHIARSIGRGVSFFATAASVTPFVGLFGTVWGIMHSFIGIAEANQTSLAVVAPGIAEALLATAFGLIVAIPATVMYNVVGRLVSGYRARLTDCSAEILCLVGRDTDRGGPRGNGHPIVASAA